MKRISIVNKILEHSTDEEVLAQVLEYISQTRANCDPQAAEYVLVVQAEALLTAYLKKKYPDGELQVII